MARSELAHSGVARTCFLSLHPDFLGAVTLHQVPHQGPPGYWVTLMPRALAHLSTLKPLVENPTGGLD